MDNSAFAKTILPAQIVNPTASDLSVEDRIAIHELLNRLFLAEDSRDFEALRQILTEDHIFNHAFKHTEGVEDFISWVRDNPDLFDGMRHQALNIATRKISDTEAEAVSYIIVMKLYDISGAKDSSLPGIVAHGVVRDRLIKNDGRWQIAERIYDQMAVSPAFLPDDDARKRFSLTAEKRSG